jgi:hypothetical protein
MIQPVRGRFPARRHVVEQLEDRRLLAADWQNPVLPWDVDGAGEVVPLDALLVIGDLRRHGSRQLPPVPENAPPPYLDVDGNGWVEPMDALLVIAALREEQRPLVLAASLSPASDSDGNGVVLLPHVTVVGQTLPGAAVRATGFQAGTPDVLVMADVTGRFQFSIDVAFGLNKLRVEAADRFGQNATVERTVRRGDVVLDWNASLLNVIRDWTTTSNDPFPNRIVTSQPPMVARNLALVHAAMYDAVNAVERTHQPYHVDAVAPEGASPVLPRRHIAWRHGCTTMRTS